LLHQNHFYFLGKQHNKIAELPIENKDIVDSDKSTYYFYILLQNERLFPFLCTSNLIQIEYGF